MKTTVLKNQYATVDATNLIFWESFFKGFPGFLILDGLIVCGEEKFIVHDEEIGIGGWKALSVSYHGVGKRNGDESIAFPLECAQGLELLFHEMQFFVMSVLRVSALRIDNGVIGAEAGQRVNVAVSVIAFQMAMVEPYYTLHVKQVFQLFFYLGFVPLRISLFGQQAMGGGHESASAIAL